MKKRTLSIVLACAMAAASLAGCGGGSKETTAASTEGAAADATKASEAAGGQTTLKWSVWDIGLTTYYQPLIDAFEKEHPDVKIEMVDLGSTDYQTVLATELTGSGSDFDVVTIKDVPGYMTLVNKGVLEPLDSYIQSSDVDLTQYKGLTDQITVDGKLYQLPFRNDFWVIFYNKDIFDKAGVAYPTNDMTFEQYDALARSLTVDTPGQEVYGAHYHTWRSAVQLFGVLDGKNTILDGKYEFLKPYYEMILGEQEDGVSQDYATLKTSGLHYSGAFAQGNVAMMNMGTWFISTLMDKVRTGEYTDCTNWGIAKYPHADGVEPGSTLATITSLGIPAKAPHKDLAWEFINFVSGKEGAEILASTGTIPAVMNNTVADLVSSADGFPKDDGTSVEALNTSNLYLEMPVNAKNSEIETVLNEAHDAIMTGGMSVDEGIAQMNEKVSAILAK
ncbi:carbohydrate ABC transporter substrate-binding protein, CUT1 family [Lacrimispora sphenoides]|jgi:multiple sugar transport system substrate-binding protein|uniref:ABC transporter substrate-binding protein n=1 Tax=Lacrimispora sphenoides TaxID=29370 RepID=UPI0008B3D4BC|nr:sugar ABC transporter substrate-binding protein [Lacrimispora sphenoides]SEU27478.1 carbohydrate ABC transporter substrate-binding protein, CUT1 family [Lacrimispora sphenoides]